MPANRIKALPRRRRRKADDRAALNGHTLSGEPLDPVGDGGKRPAKEIMWEAAADVLRSTRSPGPVAEIVRPGDSGKDKKTGRFTAGNRFGKGNPHARRQSEFYQALLRAVTPEGVQSLACHLWVQARNGDVQAAALLLSYLIGRPRSAVDPDQLDIGEFRLAAAAPSVAEVLRAISDSVTPAAAAAAVRYHAASKSQGNGAVAGMSAEELKVVFAITKRVLEALEEADAQGPREPLSLQLGALREARCKRREP